MVITNRPSPLYDTFIEPFYQGVDNIAAGISGKREAQIFNQTINANTVHTEIELSLLDRVGAVVVGILLLVPIINAVVFAILRAVESSHLFQRYVPDENGTTSNVWNPNASYSPHVPGEEPSPERPPGAAAPNMDEIFLQREQSGESVVPDVPPAPEPPVALAEYNRRKTDAIALLPQYPANGHLHLDCNPDVVRYNLDDVLRRYNPNHAPRRLTELYNYAGYDQGKRFRLQMCLEGYDRGLNPREAEVKVLLSKLFDFFNTNKALFPAGSEQEGLFKAQIRYVFDKIIDAHGNCVDQVLGQMESIICDVIASFESIRGAGVQTMRERILNRAAFTLFKYRANQIRTIIVAEYPEERHMADMERLVKQQVAAMMGMQGGVLNVGAQYGGMIADVEAKIENIASIFWNGQPSAARAALDNQVDIDRLSPAQARAFNNRNVRRRDSKYDPEKYLIDGLRTYHGAARTLRNELLIWFRNHYNLEADNELTTNFVRAFSEDPDVSIEDGGNLTHQGLLFLLERLQIFTRHPARPLAPIAPVEPPVLAVPAGQIPVAVAVEV
jgi:hypothetical protein